MVVLRRSACARGRRAQPVGRRRRRRTRKRCVRRRRGRRLTCCQNRYEVPQAFVKTDDTGATALVSELHTRCKTWTRPRRFLLKRGGDPRSDPGSGARSTTACARGNGGRARGAREGAQAAAPRILRSATCAAAECSPSAKRRSHVRARAARAWRRLGRSARTQALARHGAAARRRWSVPRAWSGPASRPCSRSRRRRARERARPALERGLLEGGRTRAWSCSTAAAARSRIFPARSRSAGHRLGTRVLPRAGSASSRARCSPLWCALPPAPGTSVRPATTRCRSVSATFGDNAEPEGLLARRAAGGERAERPRRDCSRARS